MSQVKHVKRKADGVVIDVPAGHYSLDHPDFEVVEDKPKKKKATPKAKAEK